jgi:hypothetical protein
MLRKSLLIFSVLCVGLLLGCFKSQTSNNNNSRLLNGNRAATTSNSSATDNGEKIGIPECDEFVAKYKACISDHVPDAKKTQYQENIEAWRKAWRQMAANQMSKETQAAACKRHIMQARESMKSFGCEF